ncbi:MAG: flippase [candidate division KSB1 bacterium]|nr:flippase [candidate division KSB1 bacterium]MDZ7276109.1 flippase [candidate division KSB1 bacterium]MDZ7287111.1 flippase [candidate division KSB1 bacterium]MDZ7296964.1 flippase [candidate division KSB1 bacterium]MDZ7306207.1 flippase [candidate division KSB1 bacterium]
MSIIGTLPPATSTEKSETSFYLKKIAKNAGLTASGQLLSQVLGPLSGIITTRALGAELYGIYTLTTYWTGTLADLSTLGFAGMLTRFSASYKGEGRLDKAKGAILLSLKIALLVGGVLALALAVLAEPFCRHVVKQPGYAHAFRFASIAVLFTAVYSIFLAALNGLQQQGHAVLANSVAANLTKLLTLVALLACGLQLYAALASSLLQDLVILMLAGFFLVKVFPGLRDPGLPATSEKKKLWQFSGTLFATSLFNKHTFQLDILFLGMFCQPAEVGLYAVALRLQPLIYMPHTAIMQIFGPVVAELNARGRVTELAGLYKTVTKWTASLSLPVFLTIVLFHQPILGIFGREFHGATLVLLILSAGNLLADIFGMAGQVLTMIGRPLVNLINSLVIAVISVVLYLTLIPQAGIIGAAVAYATATLAVNLLRLAEVHHFLRIHPLQASLWKLGVAACASSAAVVLLRTATSFGSLPQSWLWLLLLLWLLYGGCLYVLGLDDDDRVVLAAIRRRLFGGVTA